MPKRDSRTLTREKLPALVRERSRGLAYADPTRPVGALSLRSTPCTLIREYCTMRDLAPNRVINTIELHANGKTTAWTTRASGVWLPPERDVQKFTLNARLDPIAGSNEGSNSNSTSTLHSHGASERVRRGVTITTGAVNSGPVTDASSVHLRIEKSVALARDRREKVPPLRNPPLLGGVR